MSELLFHKLRSSAEELVKHKAVAGNSTEISKMHNAHEAEAFTLVRSKYSSRCIEANVTQMKRK